MTALDARDARPLTSREIAKVVNGIIGCVVTHDPPARELLPGVLEQLRLNPLDFETLDKQVGGDGPPATWATALAATVVGLGGWCDQRDVRTALRWISENLHLVCPPQDALQN